MDNRYLSRDELLDCFSLENLAGITKDNLVSTDSYNETVLKKRFDEYSQTNKALLVMCAINVAVLGAGGRQFGKIKINQDVYDITSIFDNSKILYNRVPNEKYDEDTLTARRLVRLLRFQIQEFIQKEKRPSYLWLKYTTDEEKQKFLQHYSICFPGGEHLVRNKEEINLLVLVYSKLDAKFKTNFLDRLKRVLIARNLMVPGIA